MKKYVNPYIKIPMANPKKSSEDVNFQTKKELIDKEAKNIKNVSFLSTKESCFNLT